MKRRIDFPQDVSEVLRISAKDLEDKDKHPNFCPNPCPDALSSKRLGDWQNDDELVPSLQLTSDQQQVQALADIDGIRAQPKIILVLESPHIDEFYSRRCSKLKYCKHLINPLPAPASGRTGENIKHYLPHIFNTTIFNEYRVAIINPIQYQCSLGDSGNKYRKNKIFSKLIYADGLGYGEDFVQRFRNVYNPNRDLIVCCCTDGNKIYPNCQNVLRLLHEALHDPRKRFHVLKMAHPCRWDQSCKCRCVSFLHDAGKEFVDNGKCFCAEKYQALYRLLLHDFQKGV